MHSLADYERDRELVRQRTRARLAGRAGQPDEERALQQHYQHVRTNLLHFLERDDNAENAALAQGVLLETAVTTDLDLSVRYIAPLLANATVVDAAGVLQAGRAHLHVMYHTGPYWLPIFAALRAGVACACCVPTSMPRVRENFLQIHTCLTRELTLPGKLRIIDMDTQSFAVSARQAIGQGYSLFLFMDGYTGTAHEPNPRRDVELAFLGAEITCKTTVATLALLLDAPLVATHAHRTGPLQSRIAFEPLPAAPAAASRREQAAQLSAAIYTHLAALLRESPAQWEPWQYFHAYLSDRYLAQLKSGGIGKRFRHDTESERFYFSPAGDVMVDRYTLRSYGVRRKSDSPAGGDTAALHS